MLSVLDNAYLRKAQQHPRYSPTHQKILFFLMHEKKYYTKDELLCLTNNSLETLEETLSHLEKTRIIKTEGWLVRLADLNDLCETIEEPETEKIRAKTRKSK